MIYHITKYEIQNVIVGHNNYTSYTIRLLKTMKYSYPMYFRKISTIYSYIFYNYVIVNFMYTYLYNMTYIFQICINILYRL